MADAVKFNFKEVDDLVKKNLNSQGHAVVCMRALNKTASTVRAEGRRAIREQYNVKLKDVELSIQKASRGSLKAIIEASYKPLNLLKFGAKQIKLGVKVVIKKGQAVVLKSSFIEQPKGRDWKRWGQQRQVTASTQMVFQKGTGKKLFAKQRNNNYGNYPIDPLRGPSVGAMMKSKNVYDRMQNVAHDQLGTNMMHELDYIMGKWTK